MKNQGFSLKKPVSQLVNQDRKKPARADPKIKLDRDKPTIEVQQPDTSGWLTRNESADLLRMSVTTIANYERRGKLHPRHVYRPDARGIEHRVAVYDPKELSKLPHPQLLREPAREPGEIAARCFESFSHGKTFHEVVIELRETPEHVRTLYESWLDTGGADLTIVPAAKEAFEKLVGPFTSVIDLLALVEALAKQKGLP